MIITRMAGAIIPFTDVIRMISIVLIAITPKLVAGVRNVTLEPKGHPVWFVAGDPFKLSCTVEGETDDVHVWWKESFEVTENVEKTKDSTALIPKTTLAIKKDAAVVEDSGDYICWHGSQATDVEVQVVTVNTRDANLTLGYHTTLACDVEPCLDMCFISWFKGNVPLTKIPELDGRLVFGQRNTSVSISNAQVSDVGAYTCTLQYKKDTDAEQSFTKVLGIRGKPYVVDSEVEKLKIISNTSMVLVCPAKAYPVPEVFWKRNYEIIEQSVHYLLDPYDSMPGAQLSILNPTQEDFGKYVCIMENSMGTTEYTIDLKDPNETLGGGGAGITSSAGLFVITLVFYIVTIVYRIRL